MTLRFGFQVKKVLLTGTAGGVGKALVQGFLDSGAKLAATVRSPEKLRLIEGSEEILKKLPCDFENFTEVKAMFEEAITWLGGCDIFIHTAAEHAGERPALAR